MQTVLVNYADQGFFEAQKLNTTTGLVVGGLDRAVSYKRSDLDSEFCTRNREILEKRIGAGNWLWKPYIVVKALREELAEGDVNRLAGLGGEPGGAGDRYLPEESGEAHSPLHARSQIYQP